MGLPTFRLAHYNSAAWITVAATPLQITLHRTAHGIFVSNLEAANTLGVSFDGGANFFTVPAATLWQVPDGFHCQALWVLSAKAAHSFTIVTKEG